MGISRTNIQEAPSEKDSYNDSEEQEPVRKTKLMTKRISLLHSTKLIKGELEVGDKEEPVFTKEIYKVGRSHMLQNFILAISKICEQWRNWTSK